MMEISLMTPTNVEVSKHIPDDITFYVLSKLPIKSLKRFGCARKSWSLLLDNHHFMTMHRSNFLSKDHSYYHDMSLILNLTRGQEHVLYFLSGERFENRVKLDWPKVDEDDRQPDNDDPPYDLDEDASCFVILGSASVNGTLCLHSYYYGIEKLTLWNPTTNELKTIPSIPVFSVSHQLYVNHIQYLVGYDRVKDDFKVIRFTTCRPFDHPNSSVSFWLIYSLRKNSWRKIDMDHMPPSYTGTEEVYMDGVSHWLDQRSTHIFLMSFDFSKESFITTAIPLDIDDGSYNFLVWRNLMILNGTIAFISNYEQTSTYHISILGEPGVIESWTKLFIVETFPCLEYPIGAGKNGNILFRKKDGELCWFNLSTRMIEEIGVRAESCSILFHIESILPIG